MPTFTDEELQGGPPETEATEGYPVTNFGPRRSFTDEELSPSFTAPESQGILSNAPDDSWLTAALKSAGTIGQDVVAGTVGMAGEAANLGSLIGAKAASVIDPSQSMGERHQQFVDWRRENLPWLIDYEDVKGFMTPYMGEYVPTSGAGRALQTGLGSGVMALTPGGAERTAGLGVRMLEEGLPAILGGATAQAVGEATEDPFLSMGAGLASSVLGRTGVTAARNWNDPNEVGARVAGRTIRENVTDRPSAEARLGTYDPSEFLPGLPVRSGTVSGDPGLMAMDVLLGRDSRFSPMDSAAADVAGIVAGGPKRAETMVAKGAAEASEKIRPDLASSYGISGTAPKQTASEAVRTVYQGMEEQAAKAMEDAWKDPRIANAQVFKNKVINAVDEYVGGLSETRRKLLPKDVLDTLETLKSADVKTIPLTELQDIRSRVLSYGRKAFREGENFVGGENNAFARKIGDLMNDGANIQFGDKPRVLPGAPAGSPVGTARDAWQKAVDATRSYHQTFNEGFLKDLNAETPGGTLKVAMNKTLDEAFKPSYGTQALEQLQKVTNGAINAPAADYMVARLTGDGSKLVSPKQIDAWLAQGNNAAIVDKIPGLRQRINSIRGMSATDQLADTFAKNADDPQKLVQMFDDNRAVINSAVAPGDRAYFRMLENSARLSAAEVPTTPAELKGALRSLAKGNTSDLLFAVGSGRLASTLAGIGSVMATTHLTGASWLAEVGVGGNTALGAIIGSMPINLQRYGDVGVKSWVERAMTGKVRQRAMEILQKARSDPKLMAELMSKPDPEKISHLLQAPGLVGIGVAAEQGVEDARDGFAFGGAVSDDGEAERLITETDKARKFLGSQTEAILSKPDDHVVAALNAVKNVI